MNGEKRSKYVDFVAINVPIFNKEKGEEFVEDILVLKNQKDQLLGSVFIH